MIYLHLLFCMYAAVYADVVHDVVCKNQYTNHEQFKTINETFIPQDKEYLHSLEWRLLSYQPPVHKHMVVLTLSYNNAAYCKANVSSVLEQDYDNFSVMYVDDGSTDGTGALVQDYLKNHDHHKRYTFLQHEQRSYAVKGFQEALQLIDPQSIIVTLDGDDLFTHPRVLSLLNKIYCMGDPAFVTQRQEWLAHNRLPFNLGQDVWITHGSYMTFPSGKMTKARAYSNQVIKNNSYRDEPYFSGHPRTFYAWLAKLVPSSYFFINGVPPRRSYDVALMLAMLEMAGGRVCFVPDLLVMYNRENPINIDKDFPSNENAGYYRTYQPRFQPIAPLLLV